MATLAVLERTTRYGYRQEVPVARNYQGKAYLEAAEDRQWHPLFTTVSTVLVKFCFQTFRSYLYSARRWNFLFELFFAHDIARKQLSRQLTFSVDLIHLAYARERHAVTYQIWACSYQVWERSYCTYVQLQHLTELLLAAFYEKTTRASSLCSRLIFP